MKELCTSLQCRHTMSMSHASISHAARAQEDPEWTAEKELCMRRGLPYAAPAPSQDGAGAPGPEHQAEEAAAIPVGSRCEVDPGAKRGIVRLIPAWRPLDLAAHHLISRPVR